MLIFLKTNNFLINLPTVLHKNTLIPMPLSILDAAESASIAQIGTSGFIAPPSLHGIIPTFFHSSTEYQDIALLRFFSFSLSLAQYALPIQNIADS